MVLEISRADFAQKWLFWKCNKNLSIPVLENHEFLQSSDFFFIQTLGCHIFGDFSQTEIECYLAIPYLGIIKIAFILDISDPWQNFNVWSWYLLQSGGLLTASHCSASVAEEATWQHLYSNLLTTSTTLYYKSFCY